MALENVLSQEIVQKLGWTLLHFVWQATAAAMLAAILLAGLRKATANVRYIMACAALGLIVLLPIVTTTLVPVSSPPPISRPPALPPLMETGAGGVSWVKTQLILEELLDSGLNMSDCILESEFDISNSVWRS